MITSLLTAYSVLLVAALLIGLISALVFVGSIHMGRKRETSRLRSAAPIPRKRK